MSEPQVQAAAVVGVGAILPDAPDVDAFWRNVAGGRYSISEVTPDRWDPALYYDADPKAPDKAYSKIGGWVREFAWDPLGWKLPIPPKVAEAMDDTQKWALACTRQALLDYGWPARHLDPERTAVILGNAMGGERHYRTVLRMSFPEIARQLEDAPSFRKLPVEVQQAILEEARANLGDALPPITEDTMPGELANIVAGRVANLFDFKGPNFVCDAACASALSAMSGALRGLAAGEFDAVVTGGIDRNMGASTYVKFCKIGALSATGTRPYGEGADGFVMGEGAAVFLLKRLEDAERDGDRIYAVLLGIGGASDGRGKGITAPNPVGQRLAVERAWQAAGMSPATASYVEGHGTSTRVGDVVEVEALASVFGAGQAYGAVALGSVKSNIGHLKAAAGAAGFLKTVLALHHRVLPPSLNAERPNPDIDFAHSPFRVNTAAREWPEPAAGIRRAGVSAFGFGGTNFHAVLEEYVPGGRGNGRRLVAGAELARTEETAAEVAASGSAEPPSTPTAIASDVDYADTVLGIVAAQTGYPPDLLDLDLDLEADLGIDTVKQAEVFAAIREAFSIPRDDNLKLRDYPTLNHVIDFVHQRAGTGPAGVTPPAQTTPVEAPPTGSAAPAPATPVDYAATVLGIVAAQTGYPPDLLDLDLDLEADLGIDTVKQAEVFAAIREAFSIPRDDNLKLRDYPTLNHVIDFVHQRAGTGPAGAEMGGEGAAAGADVAPVAPEAAAVPAQAAVPAAPAPAEMPAAEAAPAAKTPAISAGRKAPLRGAVAVGADTDAGLAGALRALATRASGGWAPPPSPPDAAALAAPVRVTIDFTDPADLAAKATAAAQTLADAKPAAAWKLLAARGVFCGRGAPGKVAFLYPGQGSQYVNMLRDLRAIDPVVAETFAEADEIMTPFLGRPLTDFVFADGEEAIARAEELLLQTQYTQPAVLTVDVALTRLLAAYGLEPDMVMGHSLGEYGALVAAGSLSFAAALEAVSARGREMADLTMEDNGAMVAVMAPLAEIERIVASVDGYAVVANVNSGHQAVIGGATPAVVAAMDACLAAGHTAVRLPVSHAFHTAIVAPASEPLRATLVRLDLRAPTLPVIANVDGRFYPTGADAREAMLDILARQVASPVQFVAGLDTLYEAGARVFVEVGPKRALCGFADDVLSATHDDVAILSTNHPKAGGVASFNQGLCGLYAAGLGSPSAAPAVVPLAVRAGARSATAPAAAPSLRAARPGGPPAGEPVVVTGAGLGLPGTERIFDDANIGRLLAGEQFIKPIPDDLRRLILDKHITRLVKRETGDPTFEAIERPEDVIKLAARGGVFDLAEEFGVEPDRVAALDRVTGLAIGAGLDALRDAGIPLVMHYRTTSLGTRLPRGWGLPDALRDDTGVIFGSAFPGMDAFATDLERYHSDRARREQLATLESVRSLIDGASPASAELDRRIAELGGAIEADPFVFDRRFLFRALSMGHSQFAELIGARGPNTQVNAACASTTQAVALAEDWIRAGRCRRVIVIAADDVTSDHLLPWVGAGFLATGAAATDERVEDAALPFDNRRHGMLLGMGAAGLVVESAEAARERGIRPICEVLGAVTANSAFHGTRLDVDHISSVMEEVVTQAEARGIDRTEIAPKTVFVSHETYTPARGGSAAAEVNALREVFGPHAEQVVMANTKGYTGHSMGVGIEDIAAVKCLETGLVPAVANFRDVDPDLGPLNLSRGGAYPVEYALRLAAGFGSQISMTLLRWTPGPDRTRPAPDDLGYRYRIADPGTWGEWLRQVSGVEDPVLEVVQRRLRVAEVRTAPPATPAEATPEPEVAPAVSQEDLAATVLGIVAEQTGYPPDLLDLDLDLEADLGIDTVKQAEIFATIRTAFDIPRDDNLKLRHYPTLNHVIDFVRQRAGAPTAAIAPPAEATPAEEPPTGSAEPPPNPVAIADVDYAATVLGIVAEQTGYPPDLLDLDLDLEADLGIDTVKQAEIFATIRTAFDIPRDDNLKLRHYPTLNHVIDFVRQRAGAPTGPEGPPPGTGAAVATTRARPEPDWAALAAGIAAADTVPRRVPVPVLRPPLEWCAPTGVTLEAGCRVVVMADRGGATGALTARLAAEGVTTLVIEDTPDASDLTTRLDAWLAEGPVRGVYWLPALDDEGPLDGLDPGAWKENLRARVKLLYATMRHLVSAPAAAPEAVPFLVAATRLGGRHGYGTAGATAPMGGAVTGFAKAYRREQAEALVKAVDFAVAAAPGDIAGVLVAETRLDPGCVEVGYAAGQRLTVSLEERPAGAEPGPGVEFGPETTFLVTGAAGGIVSAIVADLAAASGGEFHLLDLMPEPDRADPDLARLGSDRDGLRRDIAERIKAKGERPTPVLIERELSRLERLAAGLAAIEAVEAAGGEAHWHQVDLSDGPAVAKAVEVAAAHKGRIDVIVHAAGIEISRMLADKAPAEFDLVFDVKADGWFHLLSATRDLPLGAAVVFSSVAGRFGNGGQTDYSAANDLMCKSISALRSLRPETRALAIDWTAWAGIGMATRGSIPKMMELAGIDMLEPEAGVPTVRRELSAGARGEIVVGRRLGILVDELHPTGGLDPVAAASAVARGPMVGRVAAAPVHGRLVVETTLDPATQPFLYDHRIDGTPVLPGVMGVEAFAEAALLLAPGWHVAAVEDVEFLAPFKFYRDEPRTLTVEVCTRSAGDDALRAACRLIGHRSLPGGQEQETVHFTGTVQLTPAPPPPPERSEAPHRNGAASAGPDDIYRVYFHGPAYRVLERAWREGDRAVGEYAAGLPVDHQPPEATLVMAPRLVELCFQTAGMWQLGRDGRMALPRRIGRVSVFADGADSAGGPVEAIAAQGPAGFDATVVDASGRVLVRITGYETVDLPVAPAGDLLDPLRQAMA